MSWNITYLSEAKRDFARLDHSQQILVTKALLKVSANPVSEQEGGYGKPLGNKHGLNLSGLFKIKLRGSGIRIVYRLVKVKSEMLIVVIGMRNDDEVYEEARRRMDK